MDIADARARTKHGTAADVRIVDVNPLGTVTPEDTHGDIRRTGSRTFHYRCGQLRVNVRDGYYNDDPQGEWGAADDYPIVEIFAGNHHIAGPLAIGYCYSSETRSSYLVDCPNAWAAEVDVFRGSRGFKVRLKQDNKTE